VQIGLAGENGQKGNNSNIQNPLYDAHGCANAASAWMHMSGAQTIVL
jgi:hypothetical protein